MFQRNPYDDFDQFDELGRPKRNAQQGIQVTPPDPRRPYQLQQEQGQAAAAPFAAPRAAADARKAEFDVQRAPYQVQRDQIGVDADKAKLEQQQLETQRLRQQMAAGPAGSAAESPAQAAGFYKRARFANEGFGPGVDPRGWVAQMAVDTLPAGFVKDHTSDERKNADAFASEFIAATLRRESGAAIGPDEYRNQYQRYFPTPGDGPEQIAIKADLRKNALDALRLQAGELGPQVDAMFDKQREHMDATQRQAMTPQAQMQLSDGTTKAQADPMREAINRRLGSMMTRGAGDDAIRGYAAKVGIDPNSLNEALKFRRTPAFQQWKRQNPNTAYPVIDQGANVQTSGMERTVAELAASPIGSGLAHSANAMMAGNLPTLVGAGGGDANRARLNLQTMAEANPKASLAGDVAGTIGAYAGANAAIGKLGATAAGRYIPQFIKETPEAYKALSGRAMLGDATYGAANGYGSTGTAEGTLEGGVAGVAGGVAGRGVPRTIGGMIAPTGGKAAQLYQMGVRPSPGQRAGGIINNVEQRLQDVPVFGDFIRGTRQRARDQFEHGVFNDALKEIGDQLPKGTQLGTHAQAYMQNAFTKAYDKARSGMAFVADDEFNQGVSQLLANAKAGGLDAAGAKRLENIYKGQILRRAKDGVASGNAYKVMSSQIGKIAADAQDQEFKGAVRELGSLLDDAARRHSPKESVAAMDAADAGYAKAVRIEDAAKRRGTDTGRFTPKQYDAAVQNMSSGVRSRDYLAGRALNTDVAQSGKMLSDTIADSGTPQRMFSAMGVNALGTGVAVTHPLTLGLLGGVGAAYSPGMRNLTTGAMAPRASEAVQRVGGFFRGRRLNRGAGLGSASFADWLDEQRNR